MQTAKVTVLPYDETWKSAFEEIKTEIECAVGDWIIGVEHVGSTSVQGLSAKPCIDLDVIIEDYSVFDAVVRGLEAIGYTHEGDLGIRDRAAFKYANKPHLLKHHLYVCPKWSAELHRHLTFRDFLRENAEAARRYGAVKEEAARLFPNDIDQYIAYKSPCIEELYTLCGLK
ncbi:MAG: GrpB family protein [Clostridia bacterium]|nr:GrpB family protein [Clostridia bacterium]MBQ3574341.1 GrpB family protein [Clostridia bacterium]